MVDRILYSREVHTIDLRATINPSHWRVTVSTAKHVEITYYMRVRGVIGLAGTTGSHPVADAVVDRIPLQVSAYSRKDSEALVNTITQLAQEPGPKAIANEVLPSQTSEETGARPKTTASTANTTTTTTSSPPPRSARFGSEDLAQEWGLASHPGSTSSYSDEQRRFSTFPMASTGGIRGSRLPEDFGGDFSNRPPPSFQVANPSLPTSGESSPWQDAENEKRRLYELARERARSPPPPMSSAAVFGEDFKSRPPPSFQVANPSLLTSPSPPPPPPGESSPWQDAESEKRRLYELAREQARSPPPPPTSTVQEVNMWNGASSNKERLYFEARGLTRPDVETRSRSGSSVASVGGGSSGNRGDGVTPPPPHHQQHHPWRRAEEEKRLLYEAAQEQVRYNVLGLDTFRNDEASPPPPPAADVQMMRRPWTSAAEEKERLYNLAKAEAALGATVAAAETTEAALEPGSSASSSPSISSYSSYPLGPGEKSMVEACTYTSCSSFLL
jgi:hypothetical protein